LQHRSANLVSSSQAHAGQATARGPDPDPGERKYRTIGTADIEAARGSDRVSGSAADRVARALAMDILRGTIEPGQTLPPEDEILRRYSVSRTVLREALKTLAAKGLTVSKTRVGTVVRDRQNWNFFDADVLAWRIDIGFDAKLLETLREARLAVEPFAARLAAERATPADLAELANSVERMREAVGDRQLFARADLQFHRAVAAASGNFVLGSFSAVIETALVGATLLLPLEDDALRSEAVARHEELLNAISGKDADSAGQLMADMIGFGASVGEALATD
jgi:GntR family transcriptional regulator, galactonate operon transcriptional repressor